jgi:hypothetical protein
MFHKKANFVTVFQNNKSKEQTECTEKMWQSSRNSLLKITNTLTETATSDQSLILGKY